MLLVLAVTALVKTETSHPAGSINPSFSWLWPFGGGLTLSDFITGIILMLFIYWGWDTAVSVNEETKDRDKTFGRAAVTSTFILLAIYAVVIISTQSYAGIGSKGIGLTNTNNEGDMLSVLSTSIFGTS